MTLRAMLDQERDGQEALRVLRALWQADVERAGAHVSDLFTDHDPLTEDVERLIAQIPEPES